MVFGTLIVLHPDGRHESRSIDRATFTIGSAGDNSLVLSDPAAAPHHLQIVSDTRRSQVLDLGSPAGTQLDGARLPPAPRDLRNNSMLLVGGTRIIVNLAAEHQDDLLSSLLFEAEPARDTSANITTPGRRPPTPAPTPPAASPRSEYFAPVNQPEPAPVVQPVASTPPPSGKADISLRLSADAIQVEAGQSHGVKATVRNRSSFVDKIELGVEGVPSSWVTIRPETHDLYTQTSGESEIVIAPPRASQSEARTYPVNIVARSSIDPEGRAAAQVNLTILPYAAYNIGLDPQRRTATIEGGFALRVANNGNRLEQYRVAGDDDEDTLGFRFAPATLRVPPGESRVTRLRTRSRKFKLVGRPVPYDFTVTVEPVSGNVEPQTVRGTFSQQPPFSTWILAALVGLLLFSCLGLAGWLAYQPVRDYFIAQQMTATVQRAFEQATVQIATAVAQVETTSARQTAISETTVARETGIAETQVARSNAAGDETERQAIAQTSGAELAVARGTSQAQQAIAAGQQLTSVAQAAALQRTIDARVAPTAITAVTQVITGNLTTTPVVTMTQTFVAAPFEERRTLNLTAAALQARIDSDQTAQALQAELRRVTDEAIARERVAFEQIQTATAAAQTAQAAEIAARTRVVNFGAVGGIGVSGRQQLGGQEFQGDNLLVCFFRAERAPYPGPPAPVLQPTAEPPAPAPTVGPPPDEATAEPALLPTAEPALLPTAPPDSAATPSGSDGVLYAAPLRQPGLPCLPELAPSLFGVGQALGQNVITVNFPPVVYPNGGPPFPNQPFLTADNGDPTVVQPSVAVLYFPVGVREASLDLWQLGEELGYRVYALDEAGNVIDREEQPVATAPGPLSLTLTAPGDGRLIRTLIVIRMDTRLPPNLREDLLEARVWPLLLGLRTPTS